MIALTVSNVPEALIDLVALIAYMAVVALVAVSPVSPVSPRVAPCRHYSLVARCPAPIARIARIARIVYMVRIVCVARYNLITITPII